MHLINIGGGRPPPTECATVRTEIQTNLLISSNVHFVHLGGDNEMKSIGQFSFFHDEYALNEINWTDQF